VFNINPFSIPEYTLPPLQEYLLVPHSGSSGSGMTIGSGSILVQFGMDHPHLESSTRQSTGISLTFDHEHSGRSFIHCASIVFQEQFHVHLSLLLSKQLYSVLASIPP
jgi:hypothetical protein